MNLVDGKLYVIVLDENDISLQGKDTTVLDVIDVIQCEVNNLFDHM